MKNLREITYLDMEPDKKFEEIANRVCEVCFKEEKLYDSKMYMSLILTDEANIRRINKEHRSIDKPTDVLSFPMYEPDEIQDVKLREEVLGDVVICIPIVKQQAQEYEHSIDREFAYMLVHGFYHIIEYDHMTEEERAVMRKKEENIMRKLELSRD